MGNHNLHFVTSTHQIGIMLSKYFAIRIYIFYLYLMKMKIDGKFALVELVNDNTGDDYAPSGTAPSTKCNPACPSGSSCYWIKGVRESWKCYCNSGKKLGKDGTCVDPGSVVAPPGTAPSTKCNPACPRGSSCYWIDGVRESWKCYCNSGKKVGKDGTCVDAGSVVAPPGKAPSTKCNPACPSGSSCYWIKGVRESWKCYCNSGKKVGKD